MKTEIWMIAASAALAAGLPATSVAPRDFICPVCDKPFVDSVLMSYNNNEDALSLEDNAVNEALRRRADRLRKSEIAGADRMMALYEIQTVESHQRSVKMAALPVR